jgi:hypothetical protein
MRKLIAKGVMQKVEVEEDPNLQAADFRPQVAALAGRLLLLVF